MRGVALIESQTVGTKAPVHPARKPMMQRGWRQADLADRASAHYRLRVGDPKAKISRSLVGMFLIGERRPDADQAWSLSKALYGEVSVAQWLAFKMPAGAFRQRKGRKREASADRPGPEPIPPPLDKRH